jgi:hypothetical protein
MDAELITLQGALTGEYSVEREIGRGGMGIVYLAREVQLDRLVAIKVLPYDLAARLDLRERFLREARTAAGLTHPNIVPIHRVGEAGGLPYFIMTFVDGETLGERLRTRGPVQPAHLTRMLQDVAQALAYAHGRGVIHRDVKPDNILIEHESGRALVTDFGIALAGGDQLGADSVVMGTVHFMSPEQSTGGVIDGRSDLYSLGIVGYLAATGALPLDAPTAAELVVKKVATDAPPIAATTSAIPAALARTIDSCLARDPAKRPQDAERVVAALGGALAPVRVPLPMPLRKWAQQPTPFLEMFGVWTVGWSVAAIVAGVEIWAHPFRRNTPFVLFMELAVAPIVPIVLFQLRKTYKTLAAGYTIVDLRLALRTWRAERQEELTYEIGGEREPWYAGVLRWMPPISVASLMVLAISGMLGYQPFPPQFMEPVVKSILAFGGGSFAVLTGLGISVFTPRQQRSMVGELRSWLWNSRFGAWLARTLTPSGRALAASHFRPTEVVLSVAVADLFAALPANYREDLRDLPAVTERLTTRATGLRDEIERLDRMIGASSAGDASGADPGSSHLADLLAAARRDLGRTVSTLERIRLDLLKLHGGLTDLRPITTALESARQVDEDIERLNVAQDEVGSVLPTRPKLSPNESLTPI